MTALTRLHTVAAARAALDGGTLPDLWSTAREAGWTGLRVSEDRGGAGLGLYDAMILLEECGRRLTGHGLIGHLAATTLLDAAAAAADETAAQLLLGLCAGEQRAAVLFPRPSGTPQTWTIEGPGGDQRHVPLPRARSLDGDLLLSGVAGATLDLAGADVIIVPAVTEDGELVVGLVEAAGTGVLVEVIDSYDASRPLATLRLDDAPATQILGAGPVAVEQTWHDAQALLSTDALGVSEAALEMGVAYAKDRHAFGRPIGSYQAIKQQLVEILRLTERARSLCVGIGLAESAAPEQLPLACASARYAAEQASSYATRTNIAVHGGVGATWEHDAPLFWRRAQLSRVLLGGESAALDRVADDIINSARERAAAIAA
ncbi:acyl-CoA dehydrogenase [Conexibacter sp. W3-3-2]|uniref:acyl-CoA dehydrogenase family protein n=1 Tax=Conexibacter sp. W3-3-2 TaxID=2675227 RepID=UPI0012B82F75|nr:acyl-CoA dehydrogenase family protein [Conexibacter sp. W3-3-2]MTD47764.1 acyl-CoA dehydrogenase [Conexibacter sp. W3-3-2]